MNSSIDIHQVFADYFGSDIIKPLAYACSKKLSEGHICLDLDHYFATDKQAISVSDLLTKSKWVSDSIDKTNAFILKNNKLYLQRYFSYESDIITAIQQLITKEDTIEKSKLLEHKSELIKQIFNTEEQSENWQFIAAINAFINNFSIITGGPGTGKTTTIAKFLALAFSVNPKIRVALAAPTGKAAVRIKESILQAKFQMHAIDEPTKVFFDQIESLTIHRLLGYKKGTHYFKHNADNPLDYDIVIVDESSMIGVSLMAKLISAISPVKQIILLGDKNQLASVEAGSVFGDICQSELQINHFSQERLELINTFSDYKYSQELSQKTLLSEHIVELQKSYRFNKNMGIGQISYSVLNGDLDQTKIQSFTNDNEVQIFSEYKSKDFEEFYEGYQNYISEKDNLSALRLFSNIRLLSPIHEGDYSVNYFNQKIESFLKQKSFLNPKIGFYHNQPIIITQNDYHLKLFNGDIGLIRENTEGVLQAYFESEDGSLQSISPNFINNYKTVFAMTIHKSQGSEFKQVAVVLPPQEDLKILSKELLYTGLTRAKNKLFIFSKSSILIQASQQAVQRASGIMERINA